MDGWFELYRETCPICSKSGGCMINEKGDTVVCIREESKVVFSRNFQSWVHNLDNKKKVDLEGMKNKVKTNVKVPTSILDFMFRIMMEHTIVEDTHMEHLTHANRGMSETEIALRQYRSFPQKPWIVVKDIMQQTGYKRFSGIPGFYRNEFGWTIAGMPGILIPYRNQYNEIVGFQIRVDDAKNDVEINKQTAPYLKARVVKQPNLVQAFINGVQIWEKEMNVGETESVSVGAESGTVKLVKGQRYFWLSSASKEDGTGAGDPAPVHVAVPTSKLSKWKSNTLHKAKTVWVTEGALKADIAVEHIANVYTPTERLNVGSTFLAVPGVNSWRLLMPLLAEMEVKHVNIAFDMDVMTNHHVEFYLKELVMELKEKGYSANLVIWNEKDGKGIDDVFVNRRIPQLRKLF